MLTLRLFPLAGDVPETVHEAFVRSSPYVSEVSDRPTQMPHLSERLPPETVMANDGDGIVTGINPESMVPLVHAQYTRLADVDAPELYAVHFLKGVRPSGTPFTFNRYVGHYSLLGMQYLLETFRGHLHYELPREGFHAPSDVYQRQIKQYWFRWCAPPTHTELTLLMQISSLVENTTLKKRVMSPHHPNDATEARPFLLNLNATLVLMGFCFVFTKYCLDKNLLALQCLAKEKKLGPLWCGINWHLMSGVPAQREMNDLRRTVLDEAIDFNSLEGQGYPIRRKTASGMEWFLPWYERQQKKTEKRVARSAIPPPYGLSINK